MVPVWVAVNFDTPRKLRVLSTDVERMVFSGCHIRLLPSQIDAIYLMASLCTCYLYIHLNNTCKSYIS